MTCGGTQKWGSIKHAGLIGLEINTSYHNLSFHRNYITIVVILYHNCILLISGIHNG